LSDDWAKADYLFDAADVTKVKVYDADASSEAQSSVTDIVNKGRDVTDQFDITLKGTTVTATAKAGYLASVKGLAKPKQLTLLVPGKVNFANGRGAGQVRADFGKQAGDELTFCTNPATVDGGAKLTNAGSQTVNTQTKQTNEPNICGYVPPVKKDVVAEASQGGDQGSVDGKTVFPGQKVEYNLETQPKLPGNLAYDVTDVAVTDSYSQYLDVDKQTLEITDLNTGKFIPKTQYTSTWNDKDHTVRLSFASAYVQANWKAGANPRIIVRFEGTVSKDAPVDTRVDNQWKLTLNNSITPSNKVVNKPPKDNPSKQDTQKDATINIDGKTAMLGDQIYYRVNIDATNLTDTAYVVQRLGMVDDYDQEYLKLDTKGIQMLDQSGKDVSDTFNFQEKDGVVYAFFKTVDTLIPATGETVKGDPQPADLKAYSLAKLDALKSPAIDQKVLGQSYQVVLPMKVIKVTDGYTVRNTATQITNDEHKVTNTVSNPLKPINPSKDVVVNMGGGSADNQSIYLNSLFLYQLDSSTLPVNRAYQQITDWTITDPYDTAHDRYTGQWAVYATKDVVEYQDGKAVTLAKKGDRIAGKDVDSTKFGGDLFTAANKDGVLTVSATARFLSIASSNNETEQGWRAYVQMERIATGDVKNQFTETINGQPRPSNPVVTHTPDQTPSISIVKYDAKSGIKAGDRNDPKDALNVTGDTQIVFHITNTGKSDLAKIDLKDATIAGSGQVVDFKYPANWDSLVLKPGESTDVTGTLKGIKANDHHTDRANVTAKPVIECPVIDEDPFDDVPGKQAEGPCYDTQISAHDDWNGYVKPAASGVLAKTGADVMWLLLAGVLLAGAGAGFVVMRRRRSQAATTSRNTGEDR
jgi:adhesin isopeptide-forming family sspB-C2 type protein/fimbrial isopeptide formation D2 family protein/LPXTG-motif cell wall-anchored protein